MRALWAIYPSKNKPLSWFFDHRVVTNWTSDNNLPHHPTYPFANTEPNHLIKLQFQAVK